MSDFQAEKAIVRALHRDMASATPDTAADLLARHTHSHWLWRGMHPFHEQRGAEAVARAFWAPLLTAMTRLQRRPDIFMASLNEMDGFQGVWVVSMGHLLGLLDALGSASGPLAASPCCASWSFTGSRRDGSAGRPTSSTSRT